MKFNNKDKEADIYIQAVQDCKDGKITVEELTTIARNI